MRNEFPFVFVCLFFGFFYLLTPVYQPKAQYCWVLAWHTEAAAFMRLNGRIPLKSPYYLVWITGCDDPHTLGVTLVLDREIRRCKSP